MGGGKEGKGVGWGAKGLKPPSFHQGGSKLTQQQMIFLKKDCI